MQTVEETQDSNHIILWSLKNKTRELNQYLIYNSIRRSIFSHSFSTNLLNNLSLLEPLKIPPGKKTTSIKIKLTNAYDLYASVVVKQVMQFPYVAKNYLRLTGNHPQK